MRKRFIAIGGSAGAVQALQVILSALPKDLNAAILAVVHAGPNGPTLLDKVLQRTTELPVAYAVHQEALQPGRVYLAPPDCHMLVEQDHLILTRGPRENRCRPAVDPLFRSAAFEAGRRVIGVILTGALDDGTAGLWAVKQRGGVAVVQDPEEAAHPSMPRSALRYVTVDHKLPLAEIAPTLARLARRRLAEEGEVAMSRQIEVETRIAKGEDTLHLGMLDLGHFTPYTCPECHGVLMELKGGGIPRFRCHTGHAYSLSSLLTEVTGHVEDSLWSALRAVEASLLLLQHASKHMREQGEPSEAARLDNAAKEVDARAQMLREVVMKQKPIELDAG
jgi:two-component system chemotaxis response regulator CheB